MYNIYHKIPITSSPPLPRKQKKINNNNNSTISHNEIFHANESQQYDNDSTVKYAVQKSFARDDVYNHSHRLCITMLRTFFSTSDKRWILFRKMKIGHYCSTVSLKTVLLCIRHGQE